MHRFQNMLYVIMGTLMSSQAYAATDNRATLVANLYTFVTIFATFLGIVLMIVGLVKLKKRGDNPNDPKSFPSAIIVTILAGALAFNYSSSSNIFIKSFLGDESGYCFTIDGAETSGDTLSEQCWDSSNSEVLNNIEARVNSMSTNSAGTTIKDNAETIIALFQTIGLIYFLKGLYGMKVTSEGQSRDGYGKPIITLIASALIIDLPHTIEMIQETINYLGFGV